jgi:hypothetical protein
MLVPTRFEETPMTRRTFACAAALAFGMVFTGLIATAARAADDKSAAGTWTWTFTRQSGEKTEVTMKLKQEGDKLTGTITGPGGDTEIKEGKIKDGEVTFKVERERNGTTFTVNYKGKLEGDTIKGKSEVTRDGDTQSRDWEAKRETK